MKLEDKLFSLRKAKGLSQLKLAEEIGVSRQAISRWEAGLAKPTTENLKCLGALYNVSLEYLLNDDANELEQHSGITDETEGMSTSVPASVDDGKTGKRKIIKWVAIALGLLALLVAVEILAIVGNEGDFVTINDIQQKEVELEPDIGFDVEW